MERTQTTDNLCCKSNSSLNGTKSTNHFFFDTTGAKKKFTKRNAERGISPSAEGEEAYAASTAQTFEKV